MKVSHWLLLLALLLASGSAAGAAKAISAPALTVNVAALASTPERLYVGSFDEGLWVVERDGRPRRFRDAALNPHVNALAWSERTKTLWLGTARGLVRCAMTQAERCRRVGTSSAVHALLLRADGSLVAGGDAGLSFIEDERVRVFGKKQSAPFRSVWSLAEAQGKLFVGATNGLFWGAPAAFAPGGGALGRAAVVVGNLPDDWVTALLAGDGRLLVGTYNAGVVSFALGEGSLEPSSSDRELGYVNPAGVFALDPAALRLAIASMDGLRVGSLGGTRRLETRGRDVTALAPAANGGYWIGTRRGLEWVARLEP